MEVPRDPPLCKIYMDPSRALHTASHSPISPIAALRVELVVLCRVEVVQLVRGEPCQYV
jgi:hypothetical protein